LNSNSSHQPIFALGFSRGGAGALPAVVSPWFCPREESECKQHFSVFAFQDKQNKNSQHFTSFNIRHYIFERPVDIARQPRRWTQLKGVGGA
jgi:hypothetical protein